VAAEEKQRRDAEELARFNAELQAFAYAAAHDLKEPLRTVAACTQLLVRNAELDEKGKHVAGFIVEGVGRMSALLDGLLAFTGLTFKDPPHTISLNSAAEEAIRNLDEAIRESGATVTVERLPYVLGNESHLLQLFQNLIGNAIKYRAEAPPAIRIRAEQQGSKWTVKISDNGRGIPAEYQDQIFGLFKRLHGRDIPGTGIGLAICRKIVESMGGTIWVESRSGEGATFCFTLAGAAGESLPVGALAASVPN
jgi:light-regulated signal transduction histidine kinase (bacteriophytochrome)